VAVVEGLPPPKKIYFVHEMISLGAFYRSF